MDTAAVSALAGAGALVVGAIIGYFAVRVLANELVRRAERDGERIVEDARAEGHRTELEGQEAALKYRSDVDDELRDQRREMTRSERRLEQREEAVDRRAENLERGEESVRERESRLDDVGRELDQGREQLQTELERIAGMSVEDARTSLLDEIDEELREEQARRVRSMETSARAEADARSRKMLATVMQRMTSEITAETTVSVVPIPSDELKGRIIGREGRNIRAFEAATGCDIIIDDTPKVVTVSGFNPVRREVARVALTRLIQDGRIQPTRIDEAVDRARAEVEDSILEAGEEAVVDAEVTGLHPEIVKTLGRLRYRFSYGQNQLRHSLETSWLASALAAEMGADIEVARVGGLLHDLGK
ncbi:MAG: Rnase Y domain-containing protein, partial [Dehalococcoidia bacterium]|nr:Rnase Y domain-containing protein [Dehalococcoidia bacterium]